MNIKGRIKQIGIFAVTLILLYFVFSGTNIRELLTYIKNADWRYLFLLSISVVTALSLRGLCFKQLLYKSANISFMRSALLCLTSSALNIVLPARAGDIFRAWFVGKEYGVGKVKVFGTVMFERILDMIVICTFLFLGISLYKKSDLAFNLCLVSLAIILAGMVFAVLSYKFIDINKLCCKVTTVTEGVPGGKFIKKITDFFNRIFTAFCSGFEILDSPKRLAMTVLTSFSIWIFECLNYVITLKALHCDVHYSLTIFIICFIVFAGLIPSTSIFLGPAQIAVIAAFALYDLDKETALAVSFTEQGICTIITVVIAILFLWKNNVSYSDLKKDAN